MKARALSEGLQSPAQSGPWTPLEVHLLPSPQAPSSHSDLLVCSMNILSTLPPQDLCAGCSFCLEFFPPIYLHNLLSPHLLLAFVPMSLLHSLLWHLIWNCHLLFPPPPHTPYSFFFLLYCSRSHLQPPDILCIYVAFVCHAPLKYMFWKGRDFALFIAISLTPRIEPGTEHVFNKYLLHLSGWCKLITAFMNSIMWIYPHVFNWLSFDGQHLLVPMFCY